MKYLDFEPGEVFNLYRKSLRKGKLKRAYHCLEKLLKTFPEDIILLEKIIPLTLKMEEYALTKHWLKHKISFNKEWRDYLLLGRLEAESNNIEKAKKYLKTAEQLYDKNQKNSKAEKWYEKTVDVIEYIIETKAQALAQSQQEHIKEPKFPLISPTEIIPGQTQKEQFGKSDTKSGNNEKNLLKEQNRLSNAPEIVTVPVYSVPVKLVHSKKNMTDYFNNPVPVKETQFLVEYEYLKIQEGFDELICLKDLVGVDRYWYQIESVKKVLKYFYGRALLTDEVGLGKTIEAGILIKEYLMRNMVKRVLILTPASLVSQWKEEMGSKFNLEFVTNEEENMDNGLKDLWKEKLVIASLQLARNSRNFSRVAKIFFDLVVVDEAHHLRNRNTSSWKLVNQIQKRFILLLTATPVQNNLIELFNLITLLKPGQLKTEKEFKNEYTKSRTSSRQILNREKLRGLLREVMIRNTRSTIDLKLPKRFASTVKLEPLIEEKMLIEEIYALIRSVEIHETIKRPFMTTLLMETGSSFHALKHSLQKIPTNGDVDEKIRQIINKIDNMEETSKGRFLLDLLAKNPDEKKIIFTHYLKTLDYLCGLLDKKGLSYSKFSGNMNAKEKDESIEKFRNETNILISSESGGEGRNLQFCNTIINYDLPWNPMRIEQRIGRLHRIGQIRDVFIFNMSVKGTIEETIISILDEKINMFELVIGEIEPILGFLGEEKEFDEIILDLWLKSTDEQELARNFEEFGVNLLKAKQEYINSKELDRQLFAEDYEV
ncbi:MAG: SNF2-related protein [Elusimicrobiota bacterium]